MTSLTLSSFFLFYLDNRCPIRQANKVPVCAATHLETLTCTASVALAKTSVKCSVEELVCTRVLRTVGDLRISNLQNVG